MSTANLMTDAEITELRHKGWHPEVIASLLDRGFRPCQPDFIDLRFSGSDMKNSLGFIRQGTLPHLHITLVRDDDVQTVLERIDTGIFEAGLRVGHEGLAGSFMRFVDSCKSWRLSPAPAALETNLTHLEARLAKLETTVKANQ